MFFNDSNLKSDPENNPRLFANSLAISEDVTSVQKGVLLPESEWFQPDDAQVGAGYKEIYKNYKKWVPLAKQLGYKNSKDFSFEAMTKLLVEILDKNLPEFPKQVELNLPKLDLPKLK